MRLMVFWSLRGKYRIDRDVAEDAVWYYLDEGYPPEQAEIFAIDELESEYL